MSDVSSPRLDARRASSHPVAPHADRPSRDAVPCRAFRLRPAWAILACLLAATIAGPVLAGGGTSGGGSTAGSEEGQGDVEARFLSRVRQVTVEGRRAGEGYFSEDGTRLVFQSEREPDNPFYQIYVLDLETGESTRISPGTGKTTCAYFQPGTGRILFASTHLDPEAAADQQREIDERASGRHRRYAWDYDPDFDLFVHDPATGDTTRLTDERGYDAEGAFSPDGSLIVFTSNRGAYDDAAAATVDLEHLALDPAYYADIYLMNADGTDVRRLTDVPGYDGGPFFTADSERIIWRRFDEHGLTADIHTMRLDGSDVRRLTDFGSMSWAPYMHPSGDYAIFASNKHGFEDFELFLVDAAGAREPVRVTSTPGFDGLPVFSPDGATLAWTSNRTSDGTSQIFFAAWNDVAARDALAASPHRPGGYHAGDDGDDRDGRGDVIAAPPSASRVALDTPDLDPAPAPTGRTWRERLREDVVYLASDDLEGRLTGQRGERLAAAWIRARLSGLGLEPFDADGDYLEPFEFVEGTSLGPDNRLTITISATPEDAAAQAAERARNPHAEPASSGHSANGSAGHHGHAGDAQAPAATGPAPRTLALEAGRDYTPLALSESGDLEAPVVFAGYGLFVAGEEPYDSYDGLDVTGKWVMVLRHAPEFTSGERRQRLFQYSGIRYKALLARQRGARGLIVVNGPNSPGRQGLMSLRGDAAGISSGLHALHLLPETADVLLAQAGTTLADIQKALDGGDPRPGFDLPHVRIAAHVDLQIERAVGLNVLAVMPPAGGITDATTFYVIGAHYDHLGFGHGGNSLGTGDDIGRIHNGADDNASGVAGVLAAAELLAARRPVGMNHGIVFGFWSGEELGLIGSQEWLDAMPHPAARLAGYVNLDMVGRLRANTLTIQATGSSSEWPRLIEQANVASGFQLALSSDPYVPTDTMSFYLAEVPSLALFTGTHDDYHRPSDDADRVNFEGVERVAEFTARIVANLARRDGRIDFAKVERSGSMELATRATMRVTLGTIPDYSGGDVRGVLLGGVRTDSPAERAGVAKGDVVVRLGTTEVTNIYDYTYAIDLLRADVPIELEVERGGERLVLVVTPEGRR